MSSDLSSQQHLTPANLTMLSRVLGKVQAKNAMPPGGTGIHRLAALLIREFQMGITREEDLLSAFTGDDHIKLSVSLGEFDELFEPTIPQGTTRLRSRENQAFKVNTL